MTREREQWLTKEKLIFLAVSVWLVWSMVELVPNILSPQVAQLPPHGVAEGAAPDVEPLELLPKTNLSWYLTGDRANPFVFHREDYVVRAIEPDRPVTVVNVPRPPRQPRRPTRPTRPTKPKPPVKPVKVGPVPTRDRPKDPVKPTVAEKPKSPKPYELPVTFVGVFEPEGQGKFALLRDKESDSYIKLVEGQKYPALKITVVKVTKSSVVLENEEGKRFMLRDLLRQIQAERLEKKK